MTCVILSEYFPYFKETITVKYILINNTKWYEYDSIIKGLHYSKSSMVLLQNVQPWAMKKFTDICNDNNVTVSFLNEILKQNFQDESVFLNDSGVYQLIIGSTRSPSNSIRNWYINDVMKPSVLDQAPHISLLEQDQDFHQQNKIKQEYQQKQEEKCSWHFELKVPYECDNNLIICDKHGSKFKLSKI